MLGSVGVRDIVVAYDSITVFFDLALLTESGVHHAMTRMSGLIEKAFSDIAASEEITIPVLKRIPVCYHASFGLDIDLIAQQHGLSHKEVIELHYSRRYTVFMVGFLPGFPYLGFVDDRIATPRRTTPRQVVSQGSVGIADSQTGIYPLESPGGWNIIGRTPVKLFDPINSYPVDILPGDEIEFYPISIDDFHRQTS